jgi:hypothetical protein
MIFLKQDHHAVPQLDPLRLRDSERAQRRRLDFLVALDLSEA